MNKIEELLLAEATNQLKAKYRKQIQAKLKSYKFPEAKFKQLLATAERQLKDKLRKELTQRLKAL